MIWEAAPTGRRGRQQTYSNAAIQTCLSKKVLFGMALGQTTGFVESLLRLVGWSSPGFVDGYRLRDSSPSAAVLS